MKRFVRSLTKVAAVAAAAGLLLAWCISGWWSIPSVRGHIDASFDVNHGRYKALGYGLPFRGADEYARLLKQRYGIDLYYVDFCTVSKPERSYADAYNEVSTAAADRRFGRDVFKETYDQVVKTRAGSSGKYP